MKKILITLPFLILFLSNSVAQSAIPESKWSSHEITIDGSDNEWSKPFNYVDSISGLAFTMNNNKDNIYLCVSNTNRNKATKMMIAGWSLDLKSSEKDRKFHASIDFSKIAEIRYVFNADIKNLITLYKAMITTVTRKGFLANNGVQDLMNANGMNIGIGLDEKENIIYEIMIPIKDLIPQSKATLTELVNVEFRVNALENPYESRDFGSRSEPNSMGKSRIGAGAGRSGGGGGGQRPGESSSNANAAMSALYEKQSFTQKIKLVDKESK